MICWFTAPVDGTSPLLAETCVSRGVDAVWMLSLFSTSHTAATSELHPILHWQAIKENISYVFDLASSL